MAVAVVYSILCNLCGHCARCKDQQMHWESLTCWAGPWEWRHGLWANGVTERARHVIQNIFFPIPSQTVQRHCARAASLSVKPTYLESQAFSIHHRSPLCTNVPRCHMRSSAGIADVFMFSCWTSKRHGAWQLRILTHWSDIKLHSLNITETRGAAMVLEVIKLIHTVRVFGKQWPERPPKTLYTTAVAVFVWWSPTTAVTVEFWWP